MLRVALAIAAASVAVVAGQTTEVALGSSSTREVGVHPRRGGCHHQNDRVYPAACDFDRGSDEVPPFGWIAEEWSLRLFVRGITWRASTQEFYLSAQLSDPPRRISVQKLHPADPLGTVTEVPWEILELASDTFNAHWGIVWDNDSNCFWVSQVADNIYGGCWLVRYVWNDSAWVWGGTPADTWKVGDDNNGGVLGCLWVAGLAKDPVTGVFYCAPVPFEANDSLNHIAAVDPYTKTYLGRMAHGTQVSERGVALVPWDSSYLLTCGWNNDRMYKRDSTGAVLEEVPFSDPSDWALHVPEVRHPDSTVWLYMTRFVYRPNFYRVSSGLTWGQLGMVGVRGGPGVQFDTAPDATFVRGSLNLPGTQKAVLVDVAGRKVLGLSPGANDVRQVKPGAYFLLREDRTTSKVVVQR